MGTIASVQPHVVQLLSRRTTVAIALGQIDESLGTIAGIVLSQSTVPRAHIRRNAAIQQALRNSPFARPPTNASLALSPLPRTAARSAQTVARTASTAEIVRGGS